MARYTGPKIKISRRYGTKLGLRTNEEAFTRRPYKPGIHGPRGRRGRQSESGYGTQLNEKQKAKYMYGVLERQFHKYYEEASKSQNVGLVLLQILETRLDSVVARSGLAMTQNQARQFVTHGHVTVNGKKVSIPSFRTTPGMQISLDTDLRKRVEEQRSFSGELPTWLGREGDTVRVLDVPTREHISPIINEQLIVEYYSR